MPAAQTPRQLDSQPGQISSGKASFSWANLLLFALWFWAIRACAEHWRGNPNYSYGWVVPFLVLAFVFRRSLGFDQVHPPSVGRTVSLAGQVVFAVVVLSLAFFLEYGREEVWHQEIVLWLICLLTATATIVVFYSRGGAAFARAELFPVLFFFTAVPWPPRIEQPIVSGLMRWVASVTTELLHWLGVEAQTSGGAIALRTGLVGISEACSGVRSLQAGIMFGLAMGEWFLLRPTRRVFLLGIAIALALASNLTRTVLLALEAEKHGIEAVDRVHDTIGNIMITALILAIWVAGKLLASRRSGRAGVSIDRLAAHFRTFLRSWMSPATQPLLRTVTVAFVLGIIAARSFSAFSESSDTQTTPLFSVKNNDNNQLHPVSREVWNELRPTSGEYVHRQSADLPNGAGDCFHFFWKPSPWNRFALVHRPDICMPGVGWASVNSPETIDVTLDGHSLTCHLFRFKRGNTYALELWGVWRNGQPVPLSYTPDQVLGTTPSAGAIDLQGKRRSATEIVACSVIASGQIPAPEIAVALLRSVFDYER